MVALEGNLVACQHRVATPANRSVPTRDPYRGTNVILFTTRRSPGGPSGSTSLCISSGSKVIAQSIKGYVVLWQLALRYRITRVVSVVSNVSVVVSTASDARTTEKGGRFTLVAVPTGHTQHITHLSRVACS